MIGSLLVQIADQKWANFLGSPLSTIQINSSLSTTTPTARSLSWAILIFYKKLFTESLPFLRLCNSSLRFKIFALEVEVNLCSRVLQTYLELVIPTTSEKTYGDKVELIKESKALSLIFQAWNQDSQQKLHFLYYQAHKVMVLQQYHQCAQSINKPLVVWLADASMEYSWCNPTWLTWGLTYLIVIVMEMVIVKRIGLWKLNWCV